MLLIALSIPQGESFIYALNRVLDTFIGTIIGISLNGAITPQTDEKEKQIKEDLVELRKKEADLNKMLYDVRKQIKDQSHQKWDWSFIILVICLQCFDHIDFL